MLEKMKLFLDVAKYNFDLPEEIDSDGLYSREDLRRDGADLLQAMELKLINKISGEDHREILSILN